MQDADIQKVLNPLAYFLVRGFLKSHEIVVEGGGEIPKQRVQVPMVLMEDWGPSRSGGLRGRKRGVGGEVRVALLEHLMGLIEPSQGGEKGRLCVVRPHDVSQVRTLDRRGIEVQEASSSLPDLRE
jgi:hypothetical protein